jgi:hypothetical protein
MGSKNYTLFKNYSIGILILFSVLSCKKTENENIEKQEITTENYSLMVPKDFERTNRLNELAKVQFQKVDEDLYFIVLEQTKESFKNAIDQKLYDVDFNLYGYSKVVTNHFDEISSDFKINDFSSTKINSCNAILFSMNSKNLEDGKKVFYRYALFEDDKNFYQIMSWTNINYKDKLIGKMEGIINSFKSRSISK